LSPVLFLSMFITIHRFKNNTCRLTYSDFSYSDLSQNNYMLEVYTNCYNRSFLLVTFHTGATNLCSLLGTQVKLCSSPQNLRCDKCNLYWNVPPRLFEIALKLFYSNKYKITLVYPHLCTMEFVMDWQIYITDRHIVTSFFRAEVLWTFNLLVWKRSISFLSMNLQVVYTHCTKIYILVFIYLISSLNLFTFYKRRKHTCIIFTCITYM